MRIVFLGTPDFAVKSLEAIAKSKHEILAVVTQPDKPVGRKGEITPSAVKVSAKNLGLKVLQYDKIRLEGVEDLKTLAPDIMVTCAFGQILSQEIIDIAPKGIINVHASLLPKYRGSSPIQHAVLNGDEETGVTIMKTEIGIDTGDIVAVQKTKIGENETAGELFDRLSIIGAELIVKTLDRIEAGDFPSIPQDNEKATHVKMIKKDDAKIDWSKTAFEIKNLVRGMNPWPCAWTNLNGKNIKIFSVDTIVDNSNAEFGKVIEATGGELIIKCKGGAIKVFELQMEGAKKMDVKSFLLGRKISKGDKLQ